MEYSDLCVGIKFRLNGENDPVMDNYWTLTELFFDYGNLSYMPTGEEMAKFRLEPSDGSGSQTFNAYSIDKLVSGIFFHPNAGYNIGDSFEIKREGLNPNLRGTLLEINPEADRWPYRIGVERDSAWFAWNEITKIHSVISRERAPRAIEILKKQIAEAREELEALETALEVLEYASN